MEEYINEERDNENIPTEELRGFKKFRRWLDNFIYHYKWHTIITAFVIVTLTICTVQMCQKEEYDVHVLYAGGMEISQHETNGDTAPYVKMTGSLCRAAEDYNGDGSTSVALETLFVLTPEEVQELNKQLEESGSDERVQQSFIADQTKRLKERMYFSEYYVCLMSPGVFELCRDAEDGYGIQFSDLSKLVEDGTEVEYYGDGGDFTAIYLKSTKFSELPVFSDLPEDTLIVLRGLSEVSNTLSKEDNRENFDRSTELVKAMINYK